MTGETSTVPTADGEVAVRMVMPSHLTGAETLVGVNGGTTSITGEVGSAWAHPGFHHVETQFGTLLLDSDLPVMVLVED